VGRFLGPDLARVERRLKPSADLRALVRGWMADGMSCLRAPIHEGRRLLPRWGCFRSGKRWNAVGRSCVGGHWDRLWHRFRDAGVVRVANEAALVGVTLIGM